MIVADCGVIMDSDGHPQSVEKRTAIIHLTPVDSIIIAVSQLPKTLILSTHAIRLRNR